MTDLRSTTDSIHAEVVRSGFKPASLGREILYYDSIDSTNKQLKNLSARGAPEGTVVLADEQTAGRGRLNRTWVSPPGVGIYCSVLLRPARAATPPFLYTFLPAVAAARALRAASGLPIFIQWPNDVMLRGKKVAGILSELKLAGTHAREVISGIGMNINHTPADWPADLQETATSLAFAAGRKFARAPIVRRFLNELDSGYALLRQGNDSAVLEEWKRLSPSHFGKPVLVSGGSQGQVRGTTRGVDEDGALLVERRDGSLERVAFGEVRRVRGAAG